MLVFEDACQEKSTLLFVSEVLVPVSQTLPFAGAVNVTEPGGDGGGGSPPPSPPPPSSPPQEKISSRINKLIFSFSNYFKGFSNCIAL